MITHPEKMMFPDDGITKGELAAYHEAVAPLMLPHVRGRPVTMERFHRGIASPGFFQKNVAKGFPANCITPHVWTSRAPHLPKPDICVFDLDPAADEPARLRAAGRGWGSVGGDERGTTVAA